jgi:hypothetical protein
LFIILGILPFGYDFSEQKPFFSRKLILYKCIFVSVCSINYPHSVRLVTSSVDLSIYNAAPIIITSIELGLGLLMLIVLTISQISNLSKLMLFLRKFQTFYHSMTLLANVEVISVMAKSLANFFFKFSIYTIYMAVDVMSFEHQKQLRFVISLLNIYYPSLVLLCVNTLFYAGINLLKALTKHLNTVIAKAVLEFQQQYGKENLLHKKIERCCQMSDFLDKLCVLNHELNDLCNLFNSIFKVSMLVGLNVSFLVVVDQVSRLPQ